jgi:hypothetical protein
MINKGCGRSTSRSDSLPPSIRVDEPIDEQRLAQTAIAKRFGIPPKGDILDPLEGSGEECPRPSALFAGSNSLLVEYRNITRSYGILSPGNAARSFLSFTGGSLP